MQCGRNDDKGREKKDTQTSHKAKEKESYQKENLESVGAGLEEENSSNAYRGKQLPVGIKLKKRFSGEEAISPEPNSVETITEKNKESRNEPAEATAAQKAEPAAKDDASESAISSTSQASRDRDNGTNPTSNKPIQSQSSHAQNSQEDDDVVLVSVKPATQKTPPVSAVQKTLTTFPGFCPTSKIRVQQENPKGLHSLLTAQLEQKKVSEELGPVLKPRVSLTCSTDPWPFTEIFRKLQ